MSQTSRGTYHFGDFQLNLDLRVLVREGHRVPLGPKAYDVLTCLVANAGSPVNKTDLLKQVWPESFVEEGTLAQHVFSLRKALGDKADCIVTVPGFGYRFAGIVRHELVEASQTWARGASGDILHAMQERTHMVVEEPILPVRTAVSESRWFWFYAAAAVVVAVLTAGWARSRHGTSRDHVSVVLSEFGNATGDPTFDHSMTRALQIDLEQSPYVDVIGEREELTTLEMMGKPGDTVPTPAIAREICVRTNRQVLLTGNISLVAGEYLLTLEGVDCSTGKRLASSKAVAGDKSKVLSSLDSVAEQMRSKLGESAKSIAGYQVAIERATTPSLEALTVYSMGKSLTAQGKPATEALPFFRRAVALDPQFAMAYDALGAAYFSLDEFGLSTENFQKAVDLSGRVSERERLMLRAHYYGEGSHDVPLGLETYRLWAATYPHDPQPVVSLVSLYTSLGQPEKGIEFGEHALSLQPDNAVLYQALVRACTHAGRFDEAKTLGARAVQLGKDNSRIHASLWQIAYAEHNATDLERETEWAHHHADGWYGWFFPDLEAGAAASAGRYRESKEIYARSVAVARQEGLDDLADGLLVDQAWTESDLGESADLRATLQRLAKPDARALQVALLQASLGDVVYAEKVLASESHEANLGFFEMKVNVPRLRATIALAHGRPEEAIAALEGTAPYELIDYSVPFLRGAAYLQAGRPTDAVVEYQKIVNNPGLDPACPEFALAHLWLARAYTKGGNSSAARSEYATFLDGWKNADPDSHLLLEAKAELAKVH